MNEFYWFGGGGDKNIQPLGNQTKSLLDGGGRWKLIQGRIVIAKYYKKSNKKVHVLVEKRRYQNCFLIGWGFSFGKH